MRFWIGAVLAASTIGCAYQPGSFDYARHTFPGQRATVGCLDVAVERRDDLSVGPVIGYEFANRCNRIAKIDLGEVHVLGRGTDGKLAPLVAYDPNHELRPAWLDGRSANGEALAYVAGEGQAAPAVVEVCVDLASVAGRAPALWRCFGSRPPAAAVAGGAP